MRKPVDLSAESALGYGAAAKEAAGGELSSNPFIYSSPSFYAFELGKHFARSGRPAPRDVRMSRGDSIRGSDMRFEFRGSRIEPLEFDRVE